MEIKEVAQVGLKKDFKVSIKSEFLGDVKVEKIKKIAEKVKIQGFRPGKAPHALIESQYKGTIMNEVLEDVTNQAIEKIYKTYKIFTIGSPAVDIKEFDMEKGMQLDISFDLFPEIDTVDMSKISIVKNVVEVTEKEIDKSLEQIASYYKSFEDITEDRPSKLGDVVVIDFVGKVDGVEFEGGKGADFPLELGSNMFIPGFEEQLVNKKVHDKVEVNVKFPEDYYAPHLKGKDSVFDVEIKKLQVVTKNIDDNLAKKSGFVNLDALKEDIKNKYKSHLEQAERNNLKQRLMEELLKTKDFEMPKTLVEKEEELLWSSFLHMREHMKSHEEKGDFAAHGHTSEEIDLYTKSDDEVKKINQVKAKEKVKLGLILNDVSNKNDIKITDQDVQAFIVKESANYGSNASDMINYYKSNKQAIKQLESRVMEDKIVDFILDKVSYKENSMSFDEYTKQYGK